MYYNYKIFCDLKIIFLDLFYELDCGLLFSDTNMNGIKMN
jgi:hypothetical protein